VVADVLTELISTQRSRPLSIAVTVSALFVPASLTLFLSKPELYTTLGLNAVLLLSLGISLPIVMLCFWIWYTPLSALLKAQRLVLGTKGEEGDLAQTLGVEDPLEWPCLLSGGWTANAILFVIAALAYRHPLRIGATFLLTAVILFGVWLLFALLTGAFSSMVQRKWKERSAAQQAEGGGRKS
jgi:hypothetical protein